MNVTTFAEVRDEAGELLGHMEVPERFWTQGRTWRFHLLWRTDEAEPQPAHVQLEVGQFRHNYGPAVWCLKADPANAALLARVRLRDFTPVPSGTPPQQPA